MEFISISEKFKRLKKQLSMTAEDFEVNGLTLEVINLLETGKTAMSLTNAKKLANVFNKKADKLGFTLNVDFHYLMRSQKEDAKLYCNTQLKNEAIDEQKIRELLEIAKSYDLIEIQAACYFSLGQIIEKKAAYSSACQEYDTAIQMYKSINKEEEIGELYFRMGICKSKVLQPESSIVYLNLSNYYACLYSNKELEKNCLYNLADCYKKTNKINLSLESIDKYLSMASEKTDYLYNFAYGIKATCYEFLNEYEKAIEIYKIAIKNLEGSRYPFLGHAYNNLGLIYCYKGDFEKSLLYFEMAEKFRASFSPENLGCTLIEKSIVFIRQASYEAAIKTVVEGLRYSKEYNNLEYLIKGYSTLSEIYAKLNDSFNLEQTYLELLELFKVTKNKDKLKSTYDKLALLYSKQDKFDLCQRCLLLSNELSNKLY